MKYKKGFAPVVIIFLIVFGIAIIAGGYSVYKDNQQKKNFQAETKNLNNQPKNITNADVSNSTTVAPTTTKSQPIQVSATNQVAVSADIFPSKLSTCTPYKTTFVHPFTRQTLNKEIVGIVDGKCDYVEEMPNNGKMECKYTESDRKSAAQYYSDLDASQSSSSDITLGSTGLKTTYTINGKVVANPLQEAMTNGTCVVSGY